VLVDVHLSKAFDQEIDMFSKEVSPGNLGLKQKTLLFPEEPLGKGRIGIDGELV
jgi:hypothetical protein